VIVVTVSLIRTCLELSHHLLSELVETPACKSRDPDIILTAEPWISLQVSSSSTRDEKAGMAHESDKPGGFMVMSKSLDVELMRPPGCQPHVVNTA
jgi:hypothetical protein